MKQIKCILIIIGIFVLVILIDTIQARILELSPLISRKVELAGDSSVNKGLIIDTFYCVKDKDIVSISWHFKNSKFTCPIDEDETIYEENNSMEEEIKVENIKIMVNDEVLNVKLEENDASLALIQRLKQGDLTVNASEYGGFEKVGYLGFDLPTSDVDITTKPGDIVLYQGNQISIFYGSNTWNYTKLGEIIGKSQEELENILGNDSVSLVLSIS